MSGSENERTEAVGARVMLDCGHWLSLPWGLAPEAAVAELLHHHALCDPEPAARRSGGFLAVPPAWLPFPESSR